MATRDGKVLLIGGFDDSGAALALVEGWDPTENRWFAGPPLPTARGALAAAVSADGRVWAIGGDGGSSAAGPTASVEVLSLTSGAWSAGPPLKTARAAPAATAMKDGRILVAGGRIGAMGAIATVEVLDPTGGTWSGGAPLATARAGACALTEVDGTVVALAGTDQNGAALGGGEELGSSGTWQPLPELPQARAAPACATGSDGALYVFGGETGAPLDDATRFDVSIGAWRALPQMPAPRTDAAAARAADGRLLVVGGADAAGLVDRAWAYSPTAAAWTP